jgi:hypothetical protein
MGAHYKPAQTQARSPLQTQESVPGLVRVVERPRKMRIHIARLHTTQDRVLELVRDGGNVFFTGNAGTGKTFLLSRILTGTCKLHLMALSCECTHLLILFVAASARQVLTRHLHFCIASRQMFYHCK